MNDSFAEKMILVMDCKTIHDNSKHNESLSPFKGTIEVNMFNNVNHTNRRPIDPLLNNEEMSFSRLNHKKFKDKNKIGHNRSFKIKVNENMSLSRHQIKKEKNLSLDMNLKLNQSEILKNDMKSVRSKKFLIPLDPNLYKVDMEEVIKKFNYKENKKKKLDSLNSSKIMEKIEIMRNSSCNYEEKFNNEVKKQKELGNFSQNYQDEENLKRKKSNLAENLEYLRIVSDDKELKINQKVHDLNKELSIISEKKEKMEDIMNSETAKETKESSEESKNNFIEVKEIISKTEEDKKIETNKSNAIETNKTPSKTNSANKIKVIKNIIKTIPKKVFPPKDKPNIDLALKIVKSVSKIALISPTKKSIKSNIKLKEIEKKSPQKEKLNNAVDSENNKPKENIDINTTNLQKDNNDEVKNNNSIFTDQQDNSCFYCLKKLKSPVLLTCNHKICYECAIEIHYLNEFAKLEKLNIIKCPKCDEKTSIITTLEDLKIPNWVEPNKAIKKKTTSICEICPTSKGFNDCAEFECLNCDILCCYQCKIRHISNPRHTDHKLIKVNENWQDKIEQTLCEIHREPLKVYCFTDDKPCCQLCSSDNIHENHILKSCKIVIENANLELNSALKETEAKVNFLEKINTDLSNVKAKLEAEKDSFKIKLEKIINVILELPKECNCSYKGQTF